MPPITSSSSDSLADDHFAHLAGDSNDQPGGSGTRVVSDDKDRRQQLHNSWTSQEARQWRSTLEARGGDGSQLEHSPKSSGQTSTLPEQGHGGHDLSPTATTSVLPHRSPESPTGGLLTMDHDAAPSITVRRPTVVDTSILEGQGSTSLFSAPASPAPSSSSDPNSQYRPTLQSSNSQSHSPLLGNISGANTPTTPHGDPFNDYRMDTSPQVEAANTDSSAIPPAININEPSSPSAPSTSQLSPTAQRFSRNYSVPPVREVDEDEEGSSNVHGRKASLAPTFATEKSNASGVSTGVKGNMTAAERRMQRMSKVTKKKRESQRPNGQQMNRKAFQSTRLKEEIYKPWLEKKDPALRWARWITIASIILGFAIMGVCEFVFAIIRDGGRTLTEQYAGMDTTRSQSWETCEPSQIRAENVGSPN